MSSSPSQLTPGRSSLLPLTPLHFPLTITSAAEKGAERPFELGVLPREAEGLETGRDHPLTGEDRSVGHFTEERPEDELSGHHPSVKTPP